MSSDIVLEVDGQDIPMNDFVRNILSGMIIGAVGTLKDVDIEWRSINLSLRR